MYQIEYWLAETFGSKLLIIALCYISLKYTSFVFTGKVFFTYY